MGLSMGLEYHLKLSMDNLRWALPRSGLASLSFGWRVEVSKLETSYGTNAHLVGGDWNHGILIDST